MERGAFRWFDLLPEPIWIFDRASLRIVAANAAACEWLGYGQDELTSRTVCDIRPEEDRPALRRAVDAFRGEQTDAGRWRLATRSGTLLEASFHWRRIDFEGTPSILAMAQDVTGERARMEYLRLLESAVARQNDILLITEADPIDDPEGPRVVYVNDAFAVETGYSPDEIIGKTPRMLQGPETSRAELDRIRKALIARTPVRAELINYTKVGDPFWLEIDISPIFDASGKATHFVAVQRDITERKRAEERVRLSEERFRLLARATNDVIWDWTSGPADRKSVV